MPFWFNLVLVSTALSFGHDRVSNSIALSAILAEPNYESSHVESRAHILYLVENFSISMRPLLKQSAPITDHNTYNIFYIMIRENSQSSGDILKFSREDYAFFELCFQSGYFIIKSFLFIEIIR